MSDFNAKLLLNRIEVDYNGLPRLCGQIYDDKITGGRHPFPNSTQVVTSPFLKFDGDVAVTASGSRYKIIFFPE